MRYAGTPFGPPFTQNERTKAVELYSKSLSLEEVAEKLGRSTSGIYKILKEESFPIRRRKKIDLQQIDEILRLYYREGISAPAIARRLGLSKTTILYWLRRTEKPIPLHVRRVAGSNLVSISTGTLDLLPFVEPSHLRWVDDTMIVMRVGNSRPASILRNANVDSFFRLAGFYLAEGSKTSSRASVSNTNTNLVAYYHHVALEWVQTEIRTYNTPKKGVRAAKQLLAIGGICLRTLLLNAIDGILEFLGSSANLSGGGLVLGLSFLNGYSDGDGSVTRSKQRNTPKQRVILRLTEGRLFYAAKLVRVLRRILGVGSMYKPRRRNYYEVIATLSPQRAALLLLSGFFSEHPENRRRLAIKALDSAYLSRFVLLFSLFGAKPFSAADLARHASSIQADFIGRSVGTGQLVPVGVAKTGKDKRFHWLRSYVLSDDTQILAQ